MYINVTLIAVYQSLHKLFRYITFTNVNTDDVIHTPIFSIFGKNCNSLSSVHGSVSQGLVIFLYEIIALISQYCQNIFQKKWCMNYVHSK